MKALLLPYLDTAGLDLLATPEVDLEAVFRQQDRKLDLSIATEEATTTFLDLDINLPPLLHQLRLDTAVPALIQSNILRNDKTRVAAAACEPAVFRHVPGDLGARDHPGQAAPPILPGRLLDTGVGRLCRDARWVDIYEIDIIFDKYMLSIKGTPCSLRSLGTSSP